MTRRAQRGANDLKNKWHADDADPGSAGARICADLFRIFRVLIFRFLNLAYHLAAVGKRRERSENDHRMTIE